jgi:N-acetylglucosaminyldiphosphoundecaprenol N-acetyl-beta-D-mannosaminyltransferase
MQVRMTQTEPNPTRRTQPIFGVPIDVVSAPQAVQRMAAWARSGESRAVCICNAHSVVTAADDPHFLALLKQSDMATADGAPVAWLMRRLGHGEQRRVCGPDLMIDYLGHAADVGEAVFLYGSTPTTLAALQDKLKQRFPTLHIAGAISPPFRALTAAEDQAIIDAIHTSGAKTVWVGLGCPKQEAWITAHKNRVQAVMVGVGAAFDFHAGTVARAPVWMQRAGLEWFFRLASEPRRLWRRYLLGGGRFCWLAVLQLAGRVGRAQ